MTDKQLITVALERLFKYTAEVFQETATLNELANAPNNIDFGHKEPYKLNEVQSHIVELQAKLTSGKITLYEVLHDPHKEKERVPVEVPVEESSEESGLASPSTS